MLFGLTFLLAALLRHVFASSAIPWVPPAPCPTCSSSNYVGVNNGTLRNGPLVQGKAFNRIIQIWLENTDYNVAASSPVFQSLAKKGILLTSCLGVTHPSQPNYIAATSGDFYGLATDDFFHVPSNISTIVDLLEAKNVSWATYQENMPTDGYLLDYTSPNYNTGKGTYTYYMRKHNGLVIHDAVSNTSSRAHRIRNFNDFAADVNASALPQWIFVTPNMVDDAHDTTIDYASQWLEYWLVPLLDNANFNEGNGSNGTLVVLTFDENSNYAVQNTVYTLLLGSAVPSHLKNTTDDAFYTHYSLLSTVEANWQLGNLGRQDVNLTMANVFDFVAEATGVRNVPKPNPQPLTNLTGVFPGPLNPDAWIPFLAPVLSDRFGKTFIRPGMNLSVTKDTIGAPIDITYADDPYSGTGDIVTIY